MTQEKDILLHDLTQRLLYGVFIKMGNYYYEVVGYYPREDDTKPLKVRFQKNDKYFYVDVGLEDYKPYLRPMSSMTEEEKKELNNILEYQYYSDDSCMCESTDWLNKNHFDYRGLIPKGLALEAPEGMYGKEEQQWQKKTKNQ